VRRRAELFYQHLDGLQVLRRQVRGEFLAESRKHKAVKILRQIPCIGAIRAALLLALMQTPHRFRSKRQLWNYSGLGVGGATATARALVAMPTECRGTAASNRAQYFPMGPMEPAEVAVDEAIALRANEIGHLEEGAESLLEFFKDMRFLRYAGLRGQKLGMKSFALEFFSSSSQCVS
jgi:Transposase IS116/IS110/IS902 family